ncbi:MAG TPA: BREX system ATP-binding domain-containing protein [Armatimonadota bacterium]|jgi:hypothetical protein
MLPETVERLRAIEALRAGVPNRDVVRLLPPVQRNLEDRFGSLLDATEAGWEGSKQPPGFLIEGDFGSGKSHWLEFLRHTGLERNFVCSTVTLNKETPLYDISKLYRACVGSAAAPDRVGPALEEIAHSFASTRSAGLADLYQWLNREKDLDPRLAATVFLFEHSHDSDLREKIVAEWMGYPMRVPDLKAALREAGEASTFAIGRPLKTQAIRRFEFMSRFFRAAGYAGWLILVDETEMISKYSLRQRARAYAHLAQLGGMAKGISLPGVAAVYTITEDYAGQVLRGRKNDLVTIPARLEGTRDEPYIPFAQAGMEAIERRGTALHAVSRERWQNTGASVRQLYSEAYGWEAPETDHQREYSTSTPMRQYVRSWITVWDLRRLYNAEAHLVSDTLTMSYDEDSDLQSESAGDRDEPTITL